MKKIINKNIKIIISIIFTFLLFSIITAYYTNINKFFEDSRINDGNSGFALQRFSNEFIVDGSGIETMLDIVTGITWDKNLNHNAVGLEWALDNSYTEPTWNSITKVYSYPSGKVNYPAFAYCEDLILGDYDDYRLPTKAKLLTLINEVGVAGSTCSTLSVFGFTNCQNGRYWTENEYKPTTTKAWDVDLEYGAGAIAGYTKSSILSVVCVRSD